MYIFGKLETFLTFGQTSASSTEKQERSLVPTRENDHTPSIRGNTGQSTGPRATGTKTKQAVPQLLCPLGPNPPAHGPDRFRHPRQSALLYRIRAIHRRLFIIKFIREKKKRREAFAGCPDPDRTQTGPHSGLCMVFQPHLTFTKRPFFSF